jgi:hypothetical protein
MRPHAALPRASPKDQGEGRSHTDTLTVSTRTTPRNTNTSKTRPLTPDDAHQPRDAHLQRRGTACGAPPASFASALRAQPAAPLRLAAPGCSRWSAETTTDTRQLWPPSRACGILKARLTWLPERCAGSAPEARADLPAPGLAASRGAGGRRRTRRRARRGGGRRRTRRTARRAGGRRRIRRSLARRWSRQRAGGRWCGRCLTRPRRSRGRKCAWRASERGIAAADAMPSLARGCGPDGRGRWPCVPVNLRAVPGGI